MVIGTATRSTSTSGGLISSLELTRFDRIVRPHPTSQLPGASKYKPIKSTFLDEIPEICQTPTSLGLRPMPHPDSRSSQTCAVQRAHEPAGAQSAYSLGASKPASPHDRHQPEGAHAKGLGVDMHACMHDSIDLTFVRRMVLFDLTWLGCGFFD